MRLLSALLCPAFALWLALLPGAAQDLSALARFDADRSTLATVGDSITLRLSIGQSVPWRLRMLDSPPRLVLDTREVDWAGFDQLQLPEGVVALRAGIFRPGWSRLVVEFSGPRAIVTSEMRTEPDGAEIRVTLGPTDAQSLAAVAAQPNLPEWAAPEATALPPPLPKGGGPITVVLDPGHGGIDPGAERDGQTEAALMLTFARELKEVLVRDGRFSVILTRDEDVFVPLETRTSVARDADADIFLSLHADALAEGEASGATVYTLDETATDAASAALAERHDRDDLLAGIDLSDQDDLVAEVLMDMARTETMPRTDRLAGAITGAIKAAEIRMHRNPRQTGSFSVLKTPDIPSVLLELGFLSSARDFSRLIDPDWRARMAEAIRVALVDWAKGETEVRALQSP
jgi:N-acetylmuramoyl-L-alanine amidase